MEVKTWEYGVWLLLDARQIAGPGSIGVAMVLDVSLGFPVVSRMYPILWLPLNRGNLQIW